MSILITVLILTTILTVLFIVLTLKYWSYLDNIYQEKEKEEKEKSLAQLLDKYVVEEKKDVMKDKLAKISQIIAETEKDIAEEVETKVKIAKAQIKVKGKEFDIISSAKDQYTSFTVGLRSAMPETEEERLADMDELKSAISLLESFDEESYRIKPKKADAGLGMFYERMSRTFKKIIAEHKLDQGKLVPVQRLKYHIFQNVKNIKDNDIIPILKVMKDTNLLKDIIEINPAFHVIVFIEEDIKLNLKENVLLTFAYDEDILTGQRLKEVTEWKDDHAEKIINGLEKKGIITVLDENISVEGFGHAEERKKWKTTIEEQIQKEKEKEEEKHRRQLERKLLMKERLAREEKVKTPLPIKKKPIETESEKSKEEIIASLDDISAVDEEPPKIEFKKKPAIKTLPLPSKKPTPKTPVQIKEKKTSKDAKITKEKEELLSVMETLDELMPEIEERVKMEKQGVKIDASIDLEDLGEDEQDLEVLIPEKILNYHEKFSMLNGGFVQYDKIKEFIESKLKNVPDELMITVLKQLKELQMIQSSMKIGKNEFYLFKEIKLDPFHKKFISYSVNKKSLKNADYQKGLKWKEDKVSKIIKELQEKGILKLEKDKIIIPGIVQKE